jgi:hypothetical protein
MLSHRTQISNVYSVTSASGHARPMNVVGDDVGVGRRAPVKVPAEKVKGKPLVMRLSGAVCRRGID